MSDSVDLVRALARVVRETELAELEYEKGDLKIRLVMEPQLAPAPVAAYGPPVFAPPVAMPAAGPAPSTSPPDGLTTLSSPLAGVFYRAPSPGAPPFVSEGDTVTAGQTLCIIEAMKLMNEITAEAPCRVAKILVKNGDVVEPGQGLFKLEML